MLNTSEWQKQPSLVGVNTFSSSVRRYKTRSLPYCSSQWIVIAIGNINTERATVADFGELNNHLHLLFQTEILLGKLFNKLIRPTPIKFLRNCNMQNQNNNYNMYIVKTNCNLLMICVNMFMWYNFGKQHIVVILT
jgi:hypothetical protein